MDPPRLSRRALAQHRHNAAITSLRRDVAELKELVEGSIKLIKKNFHYAHRLAHKETIQSTAHTQYRENGQRPHAVLIKPGVVASVPDATRPHAHVSDPLPPPEVIPSQMDLCETLDCGNPAAEGLFCERCTRRRNEVSLVVSVPTGLTFEEREEYDRAHTSPPLPLCLQTQEAISVATALVNRTKRTELESLQIQAQIAANRANSAHHDETLSSVSTKLSVGSEVASALAVCSELLSVPTEVAALALSALASSSSGVAKIAHAGSRTAVLISRGSQSVSKLSKASRDVIRAADKTVDLLTILPNASAGAMNMIAPLTGPLAPALYVAAGLTAASVVAVRAPTKVLSVLADIGDTSVQVGCALTDAAASISSVAADTFATGADLVASGSQLGANSSHLLGRLVTAGPRTGFRALGYGLKVSSRIAGSLCKTTAPNVGELEALSRQASERLLAARVTAAAVSSLENQQEMRADIAQIGSHLLHELQQNPDAARAVLLALRSHSES